MQADIKEIQSLTSRINNVFINIAEKIKTSTDTQTAEYQEMLQSKEGLIIALNEKIALMEQEAHKFIHNKKNRINIGLYKNLMTIKYHYNHAKMSF